MSELIVSVSGLRGIVGETLTEDVAARYARAFLSQLPEPGPIVITRDGRASGPALAQAIQSAVASAGRDVWYGDVAATPTTGILVREKQAAGGIQISASHNPPQYNGIKLFNAEGRVVNADFGAAISRAFQTPAMRSPDANAGRIHTIADTVSRHLDKVIATVDVESIRRRRFRVLLDANHGAGSVLGPVLLNELGCDVVLTGGTPDGLFEHPPEPTAANLAALAARAALESFDATFCQDPDADRLAILDEQGQYIGEEYTLALVLMNYLAQHRGDIVVNCSTSRMAADLAAQHGVQCHLSPVGEANVIDRMLACGAVYGGEGNGGPIDPRVGLVRDSFVGMAQVLELMARREQSLSQLVDFLPRYAIHKTTIPVAREQVESVLATLEDVCREGAFAGHEMDKSLRALLAGVGASEPPLASRMDGLRLDWPDAWLLIRPSNTEPIVRAVAEAPTPERAQGLCALAEQVALSAMAGRLPRDVG